MSEQEQADRTATLETTAHIVAAYLENNRIPVGQIADLIASVSAQLDRLSAPVAPEATRPVPPVNPKKTITPDAIISLEDGKPYKALRRHLHTYGLTPNEYRAKWGLPHDYPMVAPNYSAARSALAKKLGLGRKAPPKKVTKARAKKNTA